MDPCDATEGVLPLGAYYLDSSFWAVLDSPFNVAKPSTAHGLCLALATVYVKVCGLLTSSVAYSEKCSFSVLSS